MQKLYEHSLEHTLALKFVQDSLDDTNTLSMEMLKVIRSHKGTFFTLLPETATLERLYRFDSHILLQNPMIEFGTGDTKSKYQSIPTIRTELYPFLLSKMRSAKKLISIFDDFNTTYDPNYQDDFFNRFGRHYRSEIYYLIDEPHFSKEIVLECLRMSNVIWHSLCIITTVDLDKVIGQELTPHIIQEICLNTQLIMIGAYDGEGYIFWERTGK